jgi:CMP-N,N'-diacetyllegionaminic acid synthase
MTTNKCSQAAILGLIPARGGSKAIPRKNLLPLANKPMVAWTIDAASEAGVFDRLILSTDDAEIAQLGRKLGIEVPFLRPADLATDGSTSVDVCIHALEWLEGNENYRPDFIMLLQPTSPLRSATDIRASVELAAVRQANSVVSICEVHHHPSWMKILDNEGHLRNLFAHTSAPTRRQDLFPVFALNGAIYLALRSLVLSERTFVSDGTLGYLMPPERSVDVDRAWDFYLADLILRDRERREHDSNSRT